MNKEPKKPPFESLTRVNILLLVAAVIVAFFVASLFTAISVVFYNMIASTELDFESGTGELLSITLNTTFFLIFTVIALLALRVKFSEVGFNKKNLRLLWRVVPVLLVYYILSIFIALALVLFLSEDIIDQDQDVGFDDGDPMSKTIINSLVIVTIVPVVEELLFRGILFQRLAYDKKLTRWFGRKPTVVFAAVLSSALFGLAHMQINVGIDTFIMGMFACFLMYSTKNIWAPILLHAAKNSIALVFLLNDGLL